MKNTQCDFNASEIRDGWLFNWQVTHFPESFHCRALSPAFPPLSKYQFHRMMQLIQDVLAQVILVRIKIFIIKSNTVKGDWAFSAPRTVPQSQKREAVPPYLTDAGGWVLHHCNKVSTTIKWVVIFLLVEHPVFSLKNATPGKHNKAKCNKMRYACIS